ncbi:ABC transporter permease [Devosia sp. MC521]|uniref:ABC transporter permease n=1 Tax=Devosia sp. MC521 TaxID=2759954 RepID=UPI0015FA0EFB|nr:ABC transporter permease [Devosia sp. MC521]MBJ6986158.1 ABC transporter permease [Devosia sp. MC521]QMW64355.1 ABC transporter permease [Devosia sp. MC521]
MTSFNRVLQVEWSGILLAILVGMVALAIAAPSFLTEFNLFVLLRSFCVALLVAYAQMVTLGVGQMNLAIGSLGGLVAITVGGLMDALGVPVVLAVPAAIAVGGLAGFINGWLTVRTGINGFIVTLATGSAFAGINLGITRSIPFYNLPAEFVSFGTGRIGILPLLLIVPLIVTGLLALFFSRVPTGRHMLAVGGNANAAQLSGISLPRTIIKAHTLSGLLAAVAAVLAVAQLGSAQPTIGSNWLIISFAAPIIGGASLSGGHISIIGTLLAVVLIALIENGMVLVKVDPYWVQFILGALILGAVGINRLRAIRTGGD